MREIGKRTNQVVDKIVQEKIQILKAAPEYAKLKRLVPSQLRGKELGKDIHFITTDPEGLEKTKGEEVILLSARDWGKYERFQQLCHKLAQKMGLHWATVEDLAIGVKRPIVSPRQSPTIKAALDPAVFLPKDSDPNIRYVAHSTVVPPLEAIEIMRRVQGLDEQTKGEVKAYLSSLFKDRYGCHVVELSELAHPLETQDDKVEFDVCLRVPIGYTAREVAEVYRKMDKKRREVLASLGTAVYKRRRQSKTLMKAKSLRLFKNSVSIYRIIEEKYPHADLSQGPTLRRSLINERHRGQKLLEKRRPNIDI